MKIIHITKGSIGGLDEITKRIIKKLPDFYNQEVIFFFKDGDSVYSGFKKYKVRSLTFHGETVFLNLLEIFKKLYLADVIHVHHTKTWILFSPLFIFYKKIVFSFHNGFGSGVKRNFVQNFIITLITTYVAIFSRKIVCLTNAQKDLLLKYSLLKKKFAEKTTIINNFVDKETILQGKNNFNNNVLFVGRYEKLKGFYDLMEVSKSLPSINFFLIGSNKEVKNKNITNYGIVENFDILKFFDNCSIFILPSYTEAFPLTILEAMSRGLVVLTSNIPGMSEIVEEGRNGYLFRPGDVNMMSEIILDLSKNKEKIKEISKNNLEDIKRYTDDKIIKKYIALYEIFYRKI